MSIAFDTIQGDQLIYISKEVKVENAQTTPFESNIGSPQGDSIIGPLLTIYFNNALQQLREEMGKKPIDVGDINAQWTERMKRTL